MSNPIYPRVNDNQNFTAVCESLFFFWPRGYCIHILQYTSCRCAREGPLRRYGQSSGRLTAQRSVRREAWPACGFFVLTHPGLPATREEKTEETSKGSVAAPCWLPVPRRVRATANGTCDLPGLPRPEKPVSSNTGTTA